MHTTPIQCVNINWIINWKYKAVCKLYTFNLTALVIFAIIEAAGAKFVTSIPN